jgi:PilZ domain
MALDRADGPFVDKRRKPRQQRRQSCELWIAGKRHTGIVRDVSELGLYVQTRVRAATGDKIELVFPAERERAELRVTARVARLDRLTAHFATSGAGGLGLEVDNPPPTLAPLLGAAGFTVGSPATVGDPSMRSYHVKLVALTGGGTQTLRVNAPGKEGARSRALARAGKGWKIGEVCEG